MAIDEDKLKEILTRLASKPRHETVRAELYRLLVDGLEVDLTKVHLEKSLKEVQGRIDALLGRSIIEIKSDLASELNDAKVQLLKYLQNKEGETGKNYVGIATDGALFRVYARKNRGQDKADDALESMDEYKTDPNNPRGLLIWLESVLVLKDDLLPEAEVIKIELGRESIFYRRTLKEIHRFRYDLCDNTEVATKYSIWEKLLNTAYGSEVEGRSLFLQHTYLTIVAKSIATVALLPELPDSGKDLLSGKKFEKISVSGAVESDFFDWVLAHPKGDKLVMDIVRHVQKFKWDEIQTDILKILYENLMDPSQRHELGEYYTPDWLAEKMCREVITDPLEWRIIDPACGSGTFLFHAIRLGLEHAANNNIPLDEAINNLTNNISGIDVHPVAVIFARITYLLALLPALQKCKKLVDTVNVQVYLGDSLQWSVREIVGKKDLEIIVPSEKDSHQYLTDESNGNGNIILKFPYEIAKQPKLFDKIMAQMVDENNANKSENVFKDWLSKRKDLTDNSIKMLCKTFSSLRKLQSEKRNHIWGYVARNLSRPVWLSGENQKAHVVIGNPPWVKYVSMEGSVKKRFRDEMNKAELWVGRQATSTQDLCSYFFVRSCELYLQKGGVIAFVMPYGAMTRMPYKKFITGRYAREKDLYSYFGIFDAWAFPSDVQPLFPVPACVLFAKHAISLQDLPKDVSYFSGELPSRDASKAQAEKTLIKTQKSWPDSGRSIQRSIYESRFKAGANLSPRVLIFINKVPNPLGIEVQSPLVKGCAEKSIHKPWRDVIPPENRIETDFIYPAYLGESIASYRTLEPLDVAIPWNEKEKKLMDSQLAYAMGYNHLSRWLEKAEQLWESHKQSTTSFVERINHNSALSKQFSNASPQIVYAASGTHLAATIIKDKRAVIDVKLYSMFIEDMQEAYYLLAILNSETTRAAVEQWQSEGQWGKRDFHKVIFNLPIPEFSDKQALHVDLANAAKTAEKIAAKVEPEKDGEHFTRTRSHIRKKLYEHGIAKKIDDLVATLLNLPKT